MDVSSNQPRPSTLEQIEKWLGVAAELGYRVRHDDFGAGGGGICEFGGQKWVFLDVSLSAWEQLKFLKEALPNDPIYLSMKENAQKVATRAA